MTGLVLLKRTEYFDKATDWTILERAEDGTFSVQLALCSRENLPEVDHRVRACYCPCDLVSTGASSTLEVVLGDYCRITQYSPELSSRPYVDFVESARKAESAREDPQSVYLSVDGGLFGGCCGSPYIDTYNRVVAFHLFSGDDCPPIVEVVQRKISRAQKKGAKVHSEDPPSSSGGYASMKHGLILAKLDSLVLAVRALGIVDLNNHVETDIGNGSKAV